jgi:hypothetical protein
MSKMGFLTNVHADWKATLDTKNSQIIMLTNLIMTYLDPLHDGFQSVPTPLERHNVAPFITVMMDMAAQFQDLFPALSWSRGECALLFTPPQTTLGKYTVICMDVIWRILNDHDQQPVQMNRSGILLMMKLSYTSPFITYAALDGMLQNMSVKDSVSKVRMIEMFGFGYQFVYRTNPTWGIGGGSPVTRLKSFAPRNCGLTELGCKLSNLFNVKRCTNSSELYDISDADHYEPHTRTEPRVIEKRKRVEKIKEDPQKKTSTGQSTVPKVKSVAKKLK